MDSGSLFYAAGLISGDSELRILDIRNGSSTLIGEFGDPSGSSLIDGIIVQNIAILPVELTKFSAVVVNNKTLLEWMTVTEINNKEFEIERKIANESEWVKIGSQQGYGTSSEVHSYSFVDENIMYKTKYLYRLKQVDYDGTYYYSNIVEVTNNGIPVTYNLSQNYPNPFNPSTVINYSLPSASYVKLVVTNTLGQEVSVLVNEQQKEGTYKVNFNASSLSSGVYFYSLIAENADGQAFKSVKKMMILK